MYFIFPSYRLDTRREDFNHPFLIRENFSFQIILFLDLHPLTNTVENKLRISQVRIRITWNKDSMISAFCIIVLLG